MFDTLYDYDGLGRLKSLTHQNDEQVFANYDYAWDIANRITSMNDAEYGYDKTSQLVLAEYEVLPKELYEYDANGNRKNFETGRNNQLLSDGVYDYEYDAEGNRVVKKSKTGEVTQYVWDHRNRLVQVILPKETVSYSYDYMNRMTRRNDEFVVHDGWQVVMTLDAKGEVKDRNLWGANQDELIATNDQFTLCDHLGSVRDVIDADGKVLNHIEYNAFGKLTNATNPKNLPRFRYTGKPFDDATGLQWNINRWYDAEVGRWISEDPIGFRGGDVNLSRFVANNAMIFVDAQGLKTCCPTGKEILLGSIMDAYGVVAYFGIATNPSSLSATPTSTLGCLKTDTYAIEYCCKGMLWGSWTEWKNEIRKKEKAVNVAPQFYMTLAISISWSPIPGPSPSVVVWQVLDVSPTDQQQVDNICAGLTW